MRVHTAIRLNRHDFTWPSSELIDDTGALCQVLAEVNQNFGGTFVVAFLSVSTLIRSHRREVLADVNDSALDRIRPSLIAQYMLDRRRGHEGDGFVEGDIA